MFEITDNEIVAIKKATRAADPAQPWGDTLAFARAILALRPVQVPMTDEQILSTAGGPCWSEDGVDPVLFAREVEAHHGITAQCANTTKKEQA